MKQTPAPLLWRPMIIFTCCFMLITGIIYPLIVTGIAQLFFNNLANGSLIQQNNKIIGSHLIGQNFTEAHYFWGRLSATAGFPYNALASGGSNYGPLNPKLITAAQCRIQALQAKRAVPSSLVTSSASGLDPDISIAAALFQVARIALARHVSEDAIKQLVIKQIKRRQLGILGNSRLNVLELNLALDHINYA